MLSSGFQKKGKMATETTKTENLESVESLTREAEALKVKLVEEKAKLNDVDSKCHAL